MQIAVICHFWTLLDLQCVCYQVDTPWLHGHVCITAPQQLQGQLQKAACLSWGCSLLRVCNCLVCFDLPKAGGAIDIHFFVYDNGKSKAENGWWQGESSIYLTLTMLYWSCYRHLKKLKVVDLWLKCVTGVGVLLAKSLKWGLLLCEGISCPVLDVASPILDHV